MHPYLFFYLLGGVTLIPLTVAVTVAILWLSLPSHDPTAARPTDLPPATALNDPIANREEALLANTGAYSSSLSTEEKTLRRRVRSNLSDPSSRPSSALSSSSSTSTAKQGKSGHLRNGSTSQTDSSEDEDEREEEEEDGAYSQQAQQHNTAKDLSRQASGNGANTGQNTGVNGVGTGTGVGVGASTGAIPAMTPPHVLMQADPNLNKEGYVRMTRVPRLGPSTESISDYMANMLFQPKNARPKDSYYAVLRYDTLFLYESDLQRDCKSVVPMNLYEVKIFPRNLPDNEVFNKEHPIQIKRKADAAPSTTIMDNGQDEYYIFIHTPVVKEDWYLALLYASKLRKPGTKQKIQDKAQFDQEAIKNHIRILHSDKHHEHTRWFNSFLGRIFLGVYKTQKIREIFIQKINRKTLKLKRPSFLGEIKVRSFDVGHSIPYITRTKLHDLALNGELTAEFHLAYRGGVRVEIEVDVGLGLQSVKAMKVTVVLAVLVKSISGMMTLKIKAPPTNRFWIGFQEAPNMDIVIEPIVADKAIKLNMVLQAIETKIREAMVEAIVLPNMDDYPFFDSHGTGGIFEGDEDLMPEATDESDAESVIKGKNKKSAGSRTKNARRASESSYTSESAPSMEGYERKLSWSSTGTESDADSGAFPKASTSNSAPHLTPTNSFGSNTSSSSNLTPLASTMAAKFKRFSQVHFPTKSTESLSDSVKLNTKPTVATSIATAIRTSPIVTPHSGNSHGLSKLPAAIPELNAVASLSDSSDMHGPRIFSSSPSTGPTKKDSTSSLRKLATLESPISDDSEGSGGSDNANTPTGDDPAYQALSSPTSAITPTPATTKKSVVKGSRPDFDTFPRSTTLRKWDTAPTSGQTGSDETVMPSSSSHIGIAGILEGSKSGSNTVSGATMSVQGNLANLFSSNPDKKQKKGHGRTDSQGKPKAQFSFDDIKVSGLLGGHRRRGSLPANKDSPKQEGSRGLMRTKSSAGSTANARRDEAVEGQDKAQDSLPPQPPAAGQQPHPVATVGPVSPQSTISSAPSFAPSIASNHSSSSSSSTSSTASSFLQQKSQAAIGATKAWVKRSLEDRRMSEDDPLLSGKMRAND